MMKLYKGELRNANGAIIAAKIGRYFEDAHFFQWKKQYPQAHTLRVTEGYGVNTIAETRVVLIEKRG